MRVISFLIDYFDQLTTRPLLECNVRQLLVAHVRPELAHIGVGDAIASANWVVLLAAGALVTYARVVAIGRLLARGTEATNAVVLVAHACWITNTIVPDGDVLARLASLPLQLTFILICLAVRAADRFHQLGTFGCALTPSDAIAVDHTALVGMTLEHLAGVRLWAQEGW